MKLQKRENLHIVFWLVKDFSWILGLKILGIVMAPPTLILSIWIAWKRRKNRADLFHNLAVVCWISANIVWMFGEFFCTDCTRPFAIPFFVLGFILIAYFYITEWTKKKTL